VPNEDDQRLFSEIFFKFPLIARSALVMFCTEDDAGKRYMQVALSEEDEMSKSAGYVNIFEDGSYKYEMFKK
jgi:hypothetical protein